MNNNDIIALYIGYADNDGGKVRPILVAENKQDEIVALKLTTKYDSKPERIKKRYYKLIDWKDEGLRKQSYIDTNRSVTISKNALGYTKEIGKLSSNDIEGLGKFIGEHRATQLNFSISYQNDENTK